MSTVALGVVLVLTLAGCRFPTLGLLPAPSAVHGATYPIRADFQDVLDLPIGAKVKQAGAVIGEVSSIDTSDFTAHVGMRIRTSVRLPAGSTVQVRFTTPLGEDYIAVTEPAATTDYLKPGSILPLSSTSSAPTIEDAFAALSLLVNGGGLDQIGSIVAELNTALHGRTTEVRTVLSEMDNLVSNLNAHKSDIDAALTGLHDLGVELGSGDSVIAQALAQFPPALQVLASQTAKINNLLTHVDQLGAVADTVLNKGTASLLSDLNTLTPALNSLTAVKGTLIPTMQALTKFGNQLVAASPGDYLNVAGTVTLVFSDTSVLPNATAASSDPTNVVTRLLGGGS